MVGTARCAVRACANRAIAFRGRRSAASLPGQFANGAHVAFRYGSSKASYRGGTGGEAFGLADERFSRLNKSLSVERMRVDSFVSTFR
jgi:hypothetical protein